MVMAALHQVLTGPVLPLTDASLLSNVHRPSLDQPANLFPSEGSAL
jgi:hypothetical protein